MRNFSQRIAPSVRRELSASLAASRAGDEAAAFAHLERAHVLGQASTYWHVVVHGKMLVWAWRNRSPREFAGQLLRTVAAAALTGLGWVPHGNTGGANVSPFKVMVIPSDLGDEIRRAHGSDSPP